MTDTLRHRGNLVAHLASAVHSGAGGLETIPGLLRQVLVDDGWREFITPRDDRRTPQTFEEFVTTPPLAGLGAASVDQLRRMVADEPEIAASVERAWRGEVPAAAEARRPTDDERKSRDTRLNGDSDTSASILARLKRDDPGLAQRVVDGELTANAAALQKGWRKPRIVATNPASVYRRLRELWTDEQIEELQRLILEDQP